MFKYTKAEVIAIAKKNDFIVGNTEKVLRLSAILAFLKESKCGEHLSLKGGTAINLLLLDLPRLSVDIDFDFSFNCPREEMISVREQIKREIIAFMSDEGYSLNDKSKFVHTLDSFVFSYNTVSGSRDVLKIEINYSNRIHALPIVSDSKTFVLGETVTINRLEDRELIGSKINALITRTTPRDIYDVYQLFQKGINDLDFVKKIAIFYAVLGSDIPVDFDQLFSECIDRIDRINYKRIKEMLLPVLHKKEQLDIEEMKAFVSKRLKDMFSLNDDEKEYIRQFNKGVFRQELLFGNYNVEDLSKHPMIAWKTRKINQ